MTERVKSIGGLEKDKENVGSQQSGQIVISGVSGRFPESCNMEEFSENLFGGIDMVTGDGRRWTPGLLGLPTRSGKLKDLDKFDADFFGVHAKQADFMDPQLRMLLEVTHEAIVDAGFNPQEIRGQNVGVFTGTSFSESESQWINDTKTTHGYALTGCQRTMFSNRISFAFDFKGPSFTVDTACSSSLMALDQAFSALKLGHCDAAIVGGSNLCLNPNTSLQFHKLNMLSPQGKCQSFDAAGDGYVRSEAVVAIFLQRKNVARRVYASILGAKTNTDGHKQQGVTFPSGKMQKVLLEETYKEAGVDPADVVYVEAHGTGTPAGDPQELNAIAQVFCKNRSPENPLMIGSVKSNMGHSEPASGLCGIAKVLLAMQRGIIPGNLHYNTPNPNIPALTTGELTVVSENMLWKGGIVGINSFGFGGANVHAILESNPDPGFGDFEQVLTQVPYLIPFSGRTKDSVELALQQISSKVIDAQQIRLLHEIHSNNIPGNQFRGFSVVSESPTNEIQISVDEIQAQSESPPVWFIFNGMGSQWARMGKSLMKFQTCKQSLEKSAAVLKTKNPNLNFLDILTRGNEETFDNVLNSFVSIAAIQIALVDLLTKLNINPDGIIGHSVGELGAAYADNCLTAEQVILAAHARGQAILDMGTANGDGGMAAVGLSWEEAMKKCPQGIYPACHNSKDSVTVSGPLILINDFIEQLQKEGIFARKVNSSNQAFHSRYIEPAKPKFKESLEKIIPVPVPRSSRWISSSIPESQWDSDLAKTSSADYHVGNLISPVLFQEALEKVPPSSVVIEIGPHCLLQAILKRSLPNCSHVGLLNKTHKNNSIFLCTSIGKMFSCGLNPLFSNLYPEIQFPVPLKTPSLSSVVSKCWDHSRSWNVPSFSSPSSTVANLQRSGSSELTFEISLDNEQDAFYTGHKIDGRNIFPQSGLIVLVWKSWAQVVHGSVDFDKIPFVIENLVVSSATLISKTGEAALKFHVTIIKSTGEFRIEESGILIASGTIRTLLSHDFISVQRIPIPEENDQHVVLNQQDFYKNSRLRGYEYSGDFRGVQRASFDGMWAEIEFTSWVSFLDNFIQHHVGRLSLQKKSLLLPTSLRKIVIDPQKFVQDSPPIKNSTTWNRKPVKLAAYFSSTNIMSCEGVQIHGQKLEVALRNLQRGSLHMEKFQFTPHFDEPLLNSEFKNTDDQCLQTCIGLILENLTRDDLHVLELAKNETTLTAPFAKMFCRSQPKKTCDAVVAVSDFVDLQNENKLLETAGIVLKHFDPFAESSNNLQKLSHNHNLLIVHDFNILQQILKDVETGTFVVLRVANLDLSAENRSKIQPLEDFDLSSVAHKVSEDYEYYLFRKLGKQQVPDCQQLSSATIDISKTPSGELDYNYNYEWVENLKVEMRKASKDKIDQGFRINVISKAFTSEQFVPSGILGLVNSLRQEPGGQALRCFFINDPNPPALDFQQPDQKLKTLIQADLVMNVYQNGKWGSYRFFPLQPQNSQQVEGAYLNFQKRGDLSSFQWFESSLKYSKEELCSVYYSALNFRDVMLASGKLNPGSLPNNLGTQDCVLGMEFSGLDPKGKRVMGILPAKAMATCVVPDPGFLWEVPSSWTLADGATVPVAYATAYYALVVRGRLKRGESLLIHGGAGAVGLAAISIALSKNCRVFTTVGSTEKREFLKTTFPQLDDSCFSNSRDTSFLNHINKETEGQGVDVVLNSLAGDHQLASIDCTAQHGRFLELGKVDLFNDTKLGMSVFLKNVSFCGILLDSLTKANYHKRKVWKLCQSGIESGVVRPLKHTVYSDSTNEIEKAFRFMASGKHIGKVLIQIRQDQENPEDKIIKALPRTYFDPAKSYIILGGLGGFGLELCDWMIERGATKLMLISRSGVTTGYQKLCINRWTKSAQVSVVTSTKDATTFEGATQILKSAIDYFDGAAIGGIFNLAMVLRDGLLENQTPENFEAVAKPKINASMAMDNASRTLAPDLEYFVCFSSVVSGRGAPGLSNYAYTNSALERTCEMRKSDGFPALAIQWGAIGDVGVLVDKLKLQEDESAEGMAPQKINSCLHTLDNFLQLSQLKTSDDDFVTLSSIILSSKSDFQASVGQHSWLESIARILGLKVAELEQNPEKSFRSFGMDSLMAAEVKQVIEVTCGRSTTKHATDLPNFSLSKLQEIMPETTINQEHPQLQKEEQEIMEPKGLETGWSDKDSESESKKDLPGNVEHANLEDCLLFEEPQAKNSFTAMLENPQKLIAYFFSMLLLSITYLIFTPISSVIQMCAQITIYLFEDSSQIKLVNGIGESLFITRNTTSVHILKFSGVPKKEEIVSLLRTRLFEPPSSVKVHSTSNNRINIQEIDAFNVSWEKLKWTIKQGFWFCYWKKDQNFDVARHVVFEDIETINLDSEMPRLAKYYHNLKWNVQDQEDSLSALSSRPWWEFRIVNSEKAQEFLMVFVWNHAYGDGPSVVRLFQQLFMEVPLSAPVSKETGPDSSTSVSDKPLQLSMFQELTHIVTKSRHSLKNAHMLIKINADVLLQTWETRNDSFVFKSESHAASAFGKFPLSILKYVKDPETGKSFNLNAVLLTICSRVYRRIVKESKSSRTKCPTQLFPVVTWSPFDDSQLNLVNSSVMVPVPVPLDFVSDSDLKQKFLIKEDTKTMLQTLRITQRNLAVTGELEKLLMARWFLQNVSAFPVPLVRLMFESSFKSTFLFSNMLAILPKTTHLVNGYQLKDFYGFSVPVPMALIAITDSVNDSLSITLTVGDTILNGISPKFHQLFFPYFEQEIKRLQNCCGKQSKQ